MGSHQRSKSMHSPVAIQHTSRFSLQDLSQLKLPQLPNSHSTSNLSQISTSSITSLSHKQLSKLSNSKISNKLHIRSSNHIIPIPLTLRLPPKLSSHHSPQSSSPSSPSSSRHSISPTRQQYQPQSPEKNEGIRLVYTGNGYEQLTPLSESQLGIRSLETKLLSNDELSVIDEISSYERSDYGRSQSGRYDHDKYINADTINHNNKNNNNSPMMNKSGINIQQNSKNDGFRSPQGLTKKRIKSIDTNVTVSSINSFNEPFPADLIDNEHSDIGSNVHLLPKDLTNDFKNAYNMDKARVCQTNHTNIVQFNEPNQNNRDIPIQQKQAASYQSPQYQTRELKPPPPNQRISSINSYLSNSSWDSLQKSIDIGVYNESKMFSGESIVSSENVLDRPSTSKWADVPGSGSGSSLDWIDDRERNSDWEDDKPFSRESSGSDSDDVVYKDIELSEKKLPNLPISQDTILVDLSPEYHDQENGEVEAAKDKIQEIDPDENETENENRNADESFNIGAGLNFEFPNNETNITNQVSRCPTPTPNRTKVYSDTIEIPDLDDNHSWFSEPGLSAYESSSQTSAVVFPRPDGQNFTTVTSERQPQSINMDNNNNDNDADESILEPLEFPSLKAQKIVKEVYKNAFDDDFSDTDIESKQSFKPFVQSSIRDRRIPNIRADDDESIHATTIANTQANRGSTYGLGLINANGSAINIATKTPSVTSSTTKRQRHQRHKSMIDIAFPIPQDYKNKPLPAPKGMHIRSKSTVTSEGKRIVSEESDAPTVISKDSDIIARGFVKGGIIDTGLKIAAKSKQVNTAQTPDIPNKSEKLSTVSNPNPVKASKIKQKAIGENGTIVSREIKISQPNTPVKPLNTKKATPMKPDSSVAVINEITNSPTKSHISAEGIRPFQIHEPPAPVSYAIDFKENTFIADEKDFPMRRDSGTPQPHQFINHEKPLLRPLLKHKQNIKQDQFMIKDKQIKERNQSLLKPPGRKVSEEISASSYQTSRSGQDKSDTSATTITGSETSSITIDLTKDDYDVTLVHRAGSVSSYRSVIEKKNGKEVEIVLVDEDDDLASLYSKYNSNWDNKSTSSAGSGMSYDSAVASEVQMKLRNGLRKSENLKLLQRGSQKFRNDNILLQNERMGFGTVVRRDLNDKLSKKIQTSVIESDIDDLIRELTIKDKSSSRSPAKSPMKPSSNNAPPGNSSSPTKISQQQPQKARFPITTSQQTVPVKSKQQTTTPSVTSSQSSHSRSKSRSYISNRIQPPSHKSSKSTSNIAQLTQDDFNIDIFGRGSVKNQSVPNTPDRKRYTVDGNYFNYNGESYNFETFMKSQYT